MLKYASICARNPTAIPFADRVNKWLSEHPNIKVVQANTFPLTSEGSTRFLAWTVLYEENDTANEDSQEMLGI